VVGFEYVGLVWLCGLCRAGAEVRIVFGHGDGDGDNTRGLGLTAPDDAVAVAGLLRVYREAGFAVRASTPTTADIAGLGTTWAGKLAFSGKRRQFLELRGCAIAAP